MDTTSLYIHIPFCSRKCLFCSFVMAAGQEHRREEYVNALIREMKNEAGKKLKSIYFGGGTPSMLDEKHLDTLMDAIRNDFSYQNDIEITIEVNPESINYQKAALLKRNGFNRVSLGVQSMNDRYLKFLGRGHDVSAAQNAFYVLREAGFDNINLDLMYAFPGQTQEELEEDVRAVSLMGSEHLSLYTLTIEPKSRFFAAQMKLDDDEKLAEHYLLISHILNEYGFKQYEVSNFSKPGFESEHNRNYWRGYPYIGLGVGAHGFTGRRRYWNTSRLQDYLDLMAQGKDVIEGYEDLTDDQLIMEKVLFGLRMNEGIPWTLVPPAKAELIQIWIHGGFLSIEKGYLKTTDRGRLLLDELSSRLI
ncbi:MAG: radical SAM family heme chaperone HemW [Candidatus Omnitrophica bacterium]|nr:radical SAM family heme chaperone HemW [Candidatus Omnitrophota bacterium]